MLLGIGGNVDRAGRQRGAIGGGQDLAVQLARKMVDERIHQRRFALQHDDGGRAFGGKSASICVSASMPPIEVDIAR
jgi:hypothetical protein